ncbi:tail fiber domain-containing protein [Microbacterium sp. ASV49]|uniref:Tail fiber domain-containing protein n=2 Tax=Microbacterium candidum TaxID=3041922 RepID=A0ABT7MWP3_9MICO|nr:tail fiber domain-containing protein [Microbacterium sp. ASV49]
MMKLLGTALANTIATEINRTRDYIAQKLASLTATTLKTNGVSGAGTSNAQADIEYLQDEIDADRANITGLQGTVSGHTTQIASKASLGSDVSFGHIFTPAGRSTPVVSSYVAAYLNTDGRIGASPSSRRFKKDIAAWTPDLQALLALQVVTYRYRATLFDTSDPNRKAPPLEVGVIAEDLDALGLYWLVVYDDDGLPFAVHYDKIALALAPLIQDHEARLTALEDKP